MNKATPGERLAAKWSACKVSELERFCGATSMASSIDRLLARERRKVAEDVLAMAWNSGAVNGKSYHTLETVVRAKYGAKGKR